MAMFNSKLLVITRGIQRIFIVHGFRPKLLEVEVSITATLEILDADRMQTSCEVPGGLVQTSKNPVPIEVPQ